MMSISSKAEEVARNIRVAAQNLNELVRDAYEHDVQVQYDVRRCKHYEPGNPTLFVNVSVEI